MIKNAATRMYFPSDFLVDVFLDLTKDFVEGEVKDGYLYISFPAEAAIAVQLVQAAMIAGYEAAYQENESAMLPDNGVIH